MLRLHRPRTHHAIRFPFFALQVDIAFVVLAEREGEHPFIAGIVRAWVVDHMLFAYLQPERRAAVRQYQQAQVIIDRAITVILQFQTSVFFPLAEQSRRVARRETSALPIDIHDAVADHGLRPFL